MRNKKGRRRQNERVSERDSSKEREMMEIENGKKNFFCVSTFSSHSQQQYKTALNRRAYRHEKMIN